MIDFETLDTKSSSVVLSLGAVIFNRDSILREAEWVFDVDEQIKKGRTLSGSTISWWMQQSEDARKIFNGSIIPHSLYDFFNTFVSFIGGEKVHMWGNGSDFDTAILIDLWANHAPVGPPWRYGNNLCYRTFKKLTNCQKLLPRTGTHHNALDDARYQAQCVMAAWQKHDWSVL